MGFDLSQRTKLLASKIEVEPNLILEIDGIPYIFGARAVNQVLRIGDDWEIGDDYLIGGIIERSDSRDWIDRNGTTTNITQQLLQDKGGASSITKLKVRLIDKNDELTRIFQPNAFVPDVLSRDCNVYLGFAQGSHPEDSIRIFVGLVSDISFGAGYCDISIAHPKELAKQETFVKTDVELNGAINSSQTTISLTSTFGLLEPADAVTTFVRIDDEIIQYTGISGNDITGCTRGALFTIADNHDDGAAVESFYRLQGNAIDLALKLLLSNGGSAFKSESVFSFNQVDAETNIQNAIAFDTDNIQDDLGLVVGDKITITGASEVSNNVVDAVITGFGTTSQRSYILISIANILVDEVGTSAICDFTSKYNTLPAGAGAEMKPTQIDIDRFLLYQDQFGSAFPDYDFYIKDTINVADFIDEQILFPATGYSLPRKGKISMGLTIPPIADAFSKYLTEGNVLNPSGLKIDRSVNQRFYNSVIYKFEEDTLEEKYYRGIVTYSEESFNRIKKGNKPLVIEAKGLRRGNETDNFISANSKRLLDRYQFGASRVKCDVFYKVGFDIEAGDTVIFGTNALKVSDDKSGTRDFSPRVMEVTNTSVNIGNGRVTLELVDTGYFLDGRFATVSPSSYVGIGSTTSQIVIKKSFGTTEGELEKTKWEDYIGEKILVHDDFYTYQEEVTLLGFDQSNPSLMLVTPPLSGAPLENYVVDVPDYPDSTNEKLNRLYKTVHAFLNPTIDVVSGISATEIEVSDISKFNVGSRIEVHNEDYSVTSESTVSDIVGSNIILSTSLGFTPDNTYQVQLIGFADGGEPYRLI